MIKLSSQHVSYKFSKEQKKTPKLDNEPLLVLHISLTFLKIKQSLSWNRKNFWRLKNHNGTKILFISRETFLVLQRTFCVTGRALSGLSGKNCHSIATISGYGYHPISLFLFLFLFCFCFCFVLFCFVLFCFVLFCFVLFCFVLFCFVLVWFGLVWFGLVWFGLVFFPQWIAK